MALVLATLAGPAGVLVPASATASASAPSPSPSEADPARQAVRRAREATRAQDYAAAIEHFREALRLRPTAKIHFNIAVCHHRLMMAQAPDTPAYEEHRSAAVDEYNRYLAADPKASDADEVAEMIRALGGTPRSAEPPQPWLIDRVEPDDVPAPPSFDESDPGPTPQGPDPTTDDPAPPPVAPPPVAAPVAPRPDGPLTTPRWGLTFSIPSLLINPAQLGRSDRLTAAPTLGVALGGNGFLGTRRRLWLGGETGLSGQPLSAAARPRMSVFHFGLILELHHPLPGGRWELGGGGMLGFVSQALLFSGTPRLRCAVSQREASRRNGMLAAARFYAAVLLGRRRNHAITFRLGPGVGVLAPGTVAGGDDEQCAGEPSPFQDLGVDEGASLVLSLDVGYAPRF